jgi:hypothetical protein
MENNPGRASLNHIINQEHGELYYRHLFVWNEENYENFSQDNHQWTFCV